MTCEDIVYTEISSGSDADGDHPPDYRNTIVKLWRRNYRTYAMVGPVILFIRRNDVASTSYAVHPEFIIYGYMWKKDFIEFASLLMTESTIARIKAKIRDLKPEHMTLEPVIELMQRNTESRKVYGVLLV